LFYPPADAAHSSDHAISGRAANFPTLKGFNLLSP
jgi:hypothetical protein